MTAAAMLIAMMVSHAGAQTYWLQLAKPTMQDLRALFFTDSLHGWTGGDSGIILSTTDGAHSWTLQSGADSVYITDIFMLDVERGWALAIRPLVNPGDWNGSIFYRTTDGGVTWTGQSYAGLFFNSVFFFDTLTGWIAGEFGLIRGTTDGGASWFEPTIQPTVYSNFPAKKIKFLTPRYGYAVGGYPESAGVIWRTTDAGANWSVTGLGDAFRDFHFFDSLNIFCAGGGFDDGVGVSRSTDGGGSWSFSYVGPFGIATSVAFRNREESWAALSFSGASMYSLDSGSTWTEYANPGDIPTYEVVFTDPAHGFMVGDSGTLLAYNVGRVVAVQERWNLISLPADPGPVMKDSIFPGALSPAYKFTPGGYEQEDTLRVGRGYWLRFPSAGEYRVAGIPVTRDTIAVEAGWNMVGALSEPVSAASVLSEPPGMIASPFFAYRNGYSARDTLLPGVGYWVKTDSAGVLILDSAPE